MPFNSEIKASALDACMASWFKISILGSTNQHHL
jgi:hypothetical protein